MSGYLDQQLELAREVAQANAQATRAREAADARAVQQIVAEARTKILAAVGHGGPRIVSPPHRFRAYGNPRAYPGCVRCPYAKGHPIHV